MINKIGIIGGGAWGTALASVAQQAGRETIIYSRSEQVAEDINHTHENKVYLKGIKLASSIKATTQIDDIIDSDAIIITTPSQHFRTTCNLLTRIPSNIPLIICSKGIEQNSLKLMSEVVKEILPTQPICILSGPNFAHEIAQNLPAATTLACEDTTLAEKIISALSNFYFRLYHSTDLISTQIAGSVKNVFAIGCGIVIGKKLGENAKAALITRGLAEMGRLCIAKGGKVESLMSLAGIGDLMLTCNSLASRNTSFGVSLCEGTNILDPNKTVEGIASAKSVNALAEKLNVDMPIVNAIYKILYQQENIDKAIDALLSRPSIYKN